MSEKIVVAATKKSTGEKHLEYPCRLVVLEWRGKMFQPFSRHTQVFDGVHEDYFIHGHYFDTYEDAYSDMFDEMIRHNMNYPMGNISHYPGLDFAKSD